jgi:long-subunit acyl-CoA synthetase (AMP-forming)
VQKDPDHEFLGTRNQLKEGEPYEWLSFRNTEDMIKRFINAVSKLHLCRPIEILDSGVEQTSWRIMGFYSENRAEYVIGMLACFSDSITVIPVSSKPTDLSIS